MSCSIRVRVSLLLLVVVLGSAIVLPARAQDTGIQMHVTPALDGHVKYGEWLPLHVYLANDGGDVEAEVQADVAGNTGRALYAAPAPLPAGARKEVVLYIQPPTFAQTIHVRLVSGEQLLAEAEVDLVTHPRSTYLIGILASEPDAFASLSGLTITGRDRVQLLPLTLETLPSRVEVLRSLDALILSGLDTSSLTPAQAEALQTWAEEGGRLLIGGGVSARRTLAGLPDGLRPVEPGETVELSTLDNLAGFVGHPVQVTGPFPATLPGEPRGTVLLEEQAGPLLVQDPLGEGWVSYLALDPAASPFDAWAGTLPFWKRLLEPGAALESNVPRDIPTRMLESEQMTYALSNLPSLELPSARWLALLLGVYILLVGPVNYLLLRRLRRLDVAWVTIPTLTLLFSVAGYGLGYTMRGNDVIVNQVSILPLYPGNENVAARSYVGLFSPTRRDYDMRVGGDALIGPLAQHSYGGGGYGGGPVALNVLQGEPAQVRGLSVNQWALQSFQAETWMEGMDGVLETDLSIEEVAYRYRVQGTVRNHLDRPLKDVVFVLGSRFALLGDVGPGEELEVDAALEGSAMGAPFPWALFQRYHQGPSGPPREVMLRQSVLEAFFHTNWGPPPAPSSPMLLAWTDLSPLEVEVRNVRASHQNTTLLALHLPLPVEEGRVELPLGVLTGRALEFEGEAGECGPSGQVYLARGNATLEYALPANVRTLLPSRLTLLVGTDGGWGEPPQVALYDWTQGAWVELDSIEMDTAHEIPDPGRFVDGVGGGGIRLRAGQQEGGGMCYRFELGLEGELRSHTEEVSNE
jgi:hypothetical protein